MWAAAAWSGFMFSVSPPVNLNTATMAQLETLPEIGPATAQRIVEYRQQNGGFKKVEDLREAGATCRTLRRCAGRTQSGH